MTNEEANFIGSMNMCDEISNEAYKKIMCNCEVEEQEPCEDCISREEVIDEINRMGINAFKTYNDYSELFDFVDALPSVTPRARWIPITERLPLCEQEVLICTQRRSIGGKTKSIITSAVYEDGNMRERNSRWHWEDIEYESWDKEEDCGIIPEGWWEYRHYNPDEVYNNLVDDFILAWMPLPQPYAESEDEE